jgi:hypothetical protein
LTAEQILLNHAQCQPNSPNAISEPTRTTARSRSLNSSHRSFASSDRGSIEARLVKVNFWDVRNHIFCS